jgi:D-alanyl-lipoteichoic acid acyltransferase DltB (MBOAT superfamily)
MLFNSLQFFAFLAVVYALYLGLSHRWQNRLLLAASYLFYGSWNWRFLSLIFLSTLVDYVVAQRIHAETDDRRRRQYLFVSLAVNLGVLGVFKYFNFFVGSMIDLLNGLGLELDWQTLHIVLPVGISFYTFQTLSYSIDVYRGKLEPTKRFLDYALYVSFFPQLVAGPIERATHLLPLVLEPRTVKLTQVWRGCVLILVGLFKKVVIADGLASTVNEVFGSTGGSSGSDVLLAMYLFTIQIYCDFSGYSDIARGTAKLFGFDLMKNFMTPLFAKSPQEFWNRWHISLSSWVRDYLYLPLALFFLRRFGGGVSAFLPHLLAMALMGLWHGADWHFVFFGIFHGVLLCTWGVVRWPRETKRRLGLIPSWLVIAFYFQITCYGMMLFRAGSSAQIADGRDLPGARCMRRSPFFS